MTEIAAEGGHRLQEGGTTRKLNVLQVCDHLGWEGSRMHGVKRLFAWMIPRFDRERYNVSLVSLRKKDLSEETLDSFGVDITYLHKSKFDPATLPALLKVIDRKQIDILHLHGYGATTFGRMAGGMRRIPTILHEHANLTDTPWFQKVADTCLEPLTDIAIAVSASTAEFVVTARRIPAEKVKVVYLGVPLEEFSRFRSRDEIGAARAELGIAPDEFAAGTVTRLHESKGNSYLVDAARLVINDRPRAKFFIVGEGPLREPLEQQARALGLGDRFVFAGFARDVARVVSAFDVSVFPSLWEGTPLTVFEALAMGQPIVATDADGLLDVLTDDRDALIVPKRNSEALARAIVRLMDEPETRARLGAAARVSGQQYDIAAFVTQDGAALRLAPPGVARDAPEGRGAIGFVVSRHCARRRARWKGARMTREPTGSFVRGAPGTAPMRTGQLSPGRGARAGALLRLRWVGGFGRFPACGDRVPERRGDVLHDGVQPRARRRPHVPPRGPRARLARVSHRAGRRVPQARPRRDGLGLHAPAAVCLDHERPGLRSLALLLRQILHLLRVRRAVRARARDERLPVVPCRAPRLGGLVQLRVPAGADARVPRRDADGRFSDGVGRAGVLRVDRARTLHLRARPAGVLLLALQAGGDA